MYKLSDYGTLVSHNPSLELENQESQFNRNLVFRVKFEFEINTEDSDHRINR